LCSQLVKKEVPVDKFHSECMGIFDGKQDGLSIYRRLVLSLPDGDKRAHLVSLVDEAKALASAGAQKSEAGDEAEATGASRGSAEVQAPAPLVVPVGEGDEAPKGDAGDASPAAVDLGPSQTVDPPKSQAAAEAPASTPATTPATQAFSSSTARPLVSSLVSGSDPAAEIDKTKKAVESKEKAILSVMAKRQADLAREKKALDHIRLEMQKLARAQSAEINEVMAQLGECDKDLWYVERDFKTAEAEYKRTKERYEKMRATKDDLVGKLTSLTLNAEVRKEAKLNSIMEKLRNDGVEFPDSSLASLAE